jgi:hypothetical protein
VKPRFATFLAVGIMVLAGCAARGPEIRTDYDAAADFSRYATFSFMLRDEREARGYDTIGEQRVTAAVTRELEARGYRRVDTDADLLVNFALATEEIQEIRTSPAAVPYPYWYGWRGAYYYPWPAYVQETWVDHYERGSLFIDLIDAERRQLVWEGRASVRLTRAHQEDPGGLVDSSVAEIFARYPFRAGQGR